MHATLDEITPELATVLIRKENKDRHSDVWIKVEAL